MVKDHELIMYGISPLFEKKILIWGCGYWGKKCYSDMIELGIEKEKILLCDVDKTKQGKKIGEHVICSENQIRDIINLEDFILVIAISDMNAKKEIIHTFEIWGLEDIDIYTEFGIKYGIYYNLKDKRIANGIINQQDEVFNDEIRKKLHVLENLQYFAFLPAYEEMFLIYQAGKVGSMTLLHSLNRINKYALHTHTLRNVSYRQDSIEILAQKYNAKIISVVREPLAREISQFWENISHILDKSPRCDFEDIKKRFIVENYELREWRWFDYEMKPVFGIDVFSYPFDKEAGYTIIKKGNISLLLLTLEKMNQLEGVIREFVEDETFTLTNANIGNEKDYAFAYKAYKEKVSFSDEVLERTYNNPYIRHFYTDEQIEKFYTYWKEKSDRNKEYTDFRFE